MTNIGGMESRCPRIPRQEWEMKVQSGFRGRRCTKCRENLKVVGGSQQARNLYLIDQLAPKSEHHFSNCCCKTTTSRVPNVLNPCRTATPEAVLSLNFLVGSNRWKAGGNSYPQNPEPVRSLRYMSTNLSPGTTGIQFYCYLHQRSCYAAKAMEGSAFTHFHGSDKLKQDLLPFSQHVINCTPQTTSLHRLRQRILAANRRTPSQRDRSSAAKLLASAPHRSRLQAVTQKEYATNLLVDAETLDAIERDAFSYVSNLTSKRVTKKFEAESLPVSAKLSKYTEVPSALPEIENRPSVLPAVRSDDHSGPLITPQGRTTTARKFKKNQPRCRRPSLNAPTSSLTNHIVQDDEAYQRLFDEEGDFVVEEEPKAEEYTASRGPSTESVLVDFIQRKANPPFSVPVALNLATDAKSPADRMSVSSSTSSTSSVSSSTT